MALTIKNILLLIFVLFTAVIQANHTPDQRCQKNEDCDEPGTDMCCGFVRQKEGSGEKGFTCYMRDNIAKLNV